MGFRVQGSGVFPTHEVRVCTEVLLSADKVARLLRRSSERMHAEFIGETVSISVVLPLHGV